MISMNPRPIGYHGGDWEGIIENLDYRIAWRHRALDLSRGQECRRGCRVRFLPWLLDARLHRTNPHFGDLHTLRKLVDAAHARGIKVIFDIVTKLCRRFYDINKNVIRRYPDWSMTQSAHHWIKQSNQ